MNLSYYTDLHDSLVIQYPSENGKHKAGLGLQIAACTAMFNLHVLEGLQDMRVFERMDCSTAGLGRSYTT